MQQFYTNTIESKFIKDLIATTPLPTIDTLYKGEWIVPGCYYINDCNVVRANHITDDEAFQFDPDTSNSQLALISPYKFGSSYPGFTSTYYSINDGYDSKTHYYLGNYLRCIRDLHDINLMPFYNCYNGEYVTDIFINTSTTTTKAVDDSGNEIEVTTINHNIIQSDPNVRGKKVISIPVKFGETYSIFIDCSTQVEIMCGFYGNKGYISPTQTPAVEIKTENKYVNLRYTSFRDGFTYTTPKPEKSTYPYTRFFRMFIQLPLNIESSIVVLEGDYTTKNTAYGTYTYNEEEKQLAIDISDFPTKVKQNQTLLSDLSLTQIAGSVSYAFSDRLIEYLTYNVITGEETITQNISRVQQYASSLINAKLNHTEPFNMLSSTPDVWDTKLQTYLFNLAKESKYIQNKLDLTGYVDKDVEQVITRGQEV